MMSIRCLKSIKDLRSKEIVVNTEEEGRIEVSSARYEIYETRREVPLIFQCVASTTARHELVLKSASTTRKHRDHRLSQWCVSRVWKRGVALFPTSRSQKKRLACWAEIDGAFYCSRDLRYCLTSLVFQ